MKDKEENVVHDCCPGNQAHIEEGYVGTLWFVLPRSNSMAYRKTAVNYCPYCGMSKKKILGNTWWNRFKELLSGS